MSESRVERIARMEEILDEAEETMDRLEAALHDFEKTQKKIGKLEKYYTGGQWIRDYEADEAGKLPKDLKRGVLSEDAVHNMLERNTELLRGLRKDC